jgi:hypothetical protein
MCKTKYDSRTGGIRSSARARGRGASCPSTARRTSGGRACWPTAAVRTSAAWTAPTTWPSRLSSQADSLCFNLVISRLSLALVFLIKSLICVYTILPATSSFHSTYSIDFNCFCYCVNRRLIFMRDFGCFDFYE